jgi:hypothetical protein
MLGRQLAHLASAHQQHGAPAEAVEDLLGQLHRRERHRDGVAGDLGLGTHALGDVEGLAEERMQLGAHRPTSLGQRECVLDLTEDLRLAEHHRIQAGRDPKGMVDGVGLQMRVERRLDDAEVEAPMAAEGPEDQGPRLPRRVGHAIDLHPVARGQQHHLLQHLAGLQVVEELAQLVLLDGELLAQLHGRVLVAEAGDEQHHQEPCRPGRNNPAPSVSTSAANPTIEQ